MRESTDIKLNILCHYKQLIILLFYLLTFSATLHSQSPNYRINRGDHLQLSFWESPELNTQATVGREGVIELPIIGKITAAGLTKSELQGKIISEMALYNKLINQLTVTVLDFGSIPLALSTIPLLKDKFSLPICIPSVGIVYKWADQYSKDTRRLLLASVITHTLDAHADLIHIGSIKRSFIAFPVVSLVDQFDKRKTALENL